MFCGIRATNKKWKIQQKKNVEEKDTFSVFVAGVDSQHSHRIILM